MEFHYTAERNVQIVISLLKAHGIKKVIASPGATDVAIVASMQQDSWFEMYSSIDERSAAYMACGMAAESGEPIVITCTGATSSRNYMPGLTEAYYRQLPVLAITCCRSNANVGHYVDQVTDRSNLPNDIAIESVYAQSIHCAEDEWDVTVKVNKAILGLTHNGGGPCHINLATIYNSDFTIKEIPPARVIRRYTLNNEFPELPKGRIGVFVGAHKQWLKELTDAVDHFCEAYNAIVICDPTSNYKGKYRILMPILCEQMSERVGGLEPFDLIINIGNVSSMTFNKTKAVWRVNPDGVVRDTFRKLNCVFQMSEIEFFEKLSFGNEKKQTTLYEEFAELYNTYVNDIPELPFSNVYVAQQLSKKLPENSVLHLGIRNSLRSWGYFDIPKSVFSYCNTGGFGIDGGISSLIGASMIDKGKLYFGVFGDLLFYYDMNSLGNRDISNNVRIIVINNGLGQEFKNYSCWTSMFGSEADKYIAARGHFQGGGISQSVICAYAKSLGFEYLCASNKDEFELASERFATPALTEKPMLFEILVKSEDDSKAHELITTLTLKGKILKKAKAIANRQEIVGIKKLMR